MEFSSSDLKTPNDILKATASTLGEMATAIQSASFGLSAFAITLGQMSTILAGYAQEREFLIKIITSILLDSGTYDYTVDQQSLDNLENYGYTLTFNDDGTSTIKLEFPSQSVED